MTKVFVTGLGVISPIGSNVSDNLHGLRKGTSGIKKPEILESRYASTNHFGEVNLTNEELKKHTGFLGSTGKTRTSLMAFMAFNEAIGSAGLTEENLTSYNTAFLSASTVGGMNEHENLYNDINILSEVSEYVESYGCGAHLLDIIKEYHIKGLTDTINTACSSSANSIMYGIRLIKSGRAKRVIAGGADSLAKYTVNGFNALKILSELPCKPFDENRCGLSLGEGAAYLILESEEVSEHKKIYAEISGYGNANDAFHPSTMSDEASGVVGAVSQAITSAGLTPEQIDYINAHGTGTLNNDSAELTGLLRVFKELPPYNSTKSYTGHTLGAAGAIEVVFSLLSLANNELYPSLNVEKPIIKYNISPILKYEKVKDIRHVLTNSFGFWGNCTSLIISKA